MCLGFRGRRRRGQKRVSELDPFQISQCQRAGAQSSTRNDRRIKITDENKTRIHNANPQSQRPKNSTTHATESIQLTKLLLPKASPSGSKLSLNLFYIGSGERAEHRYVLLAENRVCVRACARQQRTDKCTLENRSCTGCNAQELDVRNDQNFGSWRKGPLFGHTPLCTLDSVLIFRCIHT
jgi:hypothetical protein